MTKELKETVKQQIVDLDLFAEDAGTGMETISNDEVMVPRIALLQSMSPAVKKKGAEYVEDAEEGMFLNRISQKLYNGDTGMTVIPMNIRQTLVEFSSRDDGGNFIADHSDNLDLWDNTPYDDQKGGKYLESGNRLVKSFEFLVCIVEDTGEISPALINFSSSQYKKGKQWFSQLRQLQIKLETGKMINPATFYSAYTLRSAIETKDSNTWMGYKITRKCDTVSLNDGMDIYKFCRDFSKSYLKGEVKVQSEAVADEAVSADPF